MDFTDFNRGIYGIVVLMIIFWYGVFTIGLFQTTMWSIVISAVVGLWIRLTGRG